MFEKIKNKLNKEPILIKNLPKETKNILIDILIENEYNSKEDHNIESISITASVTDNDVKRFIIKTLNISREYHEKDKFESKHIRNIFNKKTIFI